MNGIPVTAIVLLLALLAVAAGMAWTFAPPDRRALIEAILSGGVLAFGLADLLSGSNTPMAAAAVAATGALCLLGFLASYWRTRKASERSEPTQ